MTIKDPDFGPLMGDTKTSSVRIWAAIKPDPALPGKLNSGRIRYRQVGTTRWSKVFPFRFNKNFYYTGVVQLNDLEAATEYEYQVGVEQNTAAQTSSWKATTQRFRTARLWQSEHSFRFALGSCLYPKEYFIAGSIYSDSRQASALRYVPYWHKQKPLDLMVYMGDQIYADTGNLYNAANTDDEYVKAYHGLYSQQDFQHAISTVPTYMVMDDHEVHDGFKKGIAEFISPTTWAFRRLSPLEQRAQEAYRKHQVISALSTFYAFQACHGPVFDTLPDDQEPRIGYVKGQQGSDLPSSHYYSLDYGDCAFFMTDTRLERTKKTIMSEQQLQALQTWLKTSTARVKFVVSAVTVLVDAEAAIPFLDSPDNWAIAKSQRQDLLETIVGAGVKNVFFLSGDIHASFATSLEYKGEHCGIHQLVCSGLFWPIGVLGIGNLIRWSKDKVRFNKSIKGASNFRLSDPISNTRTNYYDGNGIGLVELSKDKLLFSVHQRSDAPALGKNNVKLKPAVISTEIKLM